MARHEAADARDVRRKPWIVAEKALDIFNNSHLLRVEFGIERAQGVDGNMLDRMSDGLQVLLVPFISRTDPTPLFFKNQDPFGLQAAPDMGQHLLQAHAGIGFAHTDGDDVVSHGFAENDAIFC